MGKEAVIFDMDGVIFDTEKVYLDIWQRVFEKYGYKMTKELYITVMGTGRENVIKIFWIILVMDFPLKRCMKKRISSYFLS